MMYNFHYLKHSKFAELLSLSEAAEIWGIDESSIRKAISQNRLVDGSDCRKFGKQWVVTVEGMHRVFTKGYIDLPPWEKFLKNSR